jgi:hypothetical protein
MRGSPTGKPRKMFQSEVKGPRNVANHVQKSLAKGMKNLRKWRDATPEKPQISDEKVVKSPRKGGKNPRKLFSKSNKNRERPAKRLWKTGPEIFSMETTCDSKPDTSNDPPPSTLNAKVASLQ